MSKWTQIVLRSSILWGGVASVGFFGLIRRHLVPIPLLEQYCAGHPVEYVETILFFVGLAGLLLRWANLAAQSRRVAGVRSLLGPVVQGGGIAATCDTLDARLDRCPAAYRDDHLVRRLRLALDFVRRRGSAGGLDEELRSLADLDAVEIHESYAMFRLILWAIPILGFLGTVIGITQAIASLAPNALEESMGAVVAGLGVAFDTTALALALSMVLMFTKFFVDRCETRLLAEVDRRSGAELLGRFEQVANTPDGQVVAVRRMAETVVQAADQLVARQAELWQASMAAAERRWARLAEEAGRQLQGALAGALVKSLQAHAQQVAAAEQSAAEQNRQHWAHLEQTITQGVQATVSLQQAVTTQAETLGRVVEATGQVARLEETLNRNLSALAGAKNFEETVISLAAAIHLLNARFSQAPADGPRVQLQSDKKAGKAA